MLLPGALPLVYSEDCAAGHLLAEAEAEVGERFILSSHDATVLELARAVKALRPKARVPPVMPLWLARAVAAGGEALSGLTGRPPLLPKGQLTFLGYGARPVADRARRRLGWSPTPFEQALAKTLDFLERDGRV